MANKAQRIAEYITENYEPLWECNYKKFIEKTHNIPELREIVAKKNGDLPEESTITSYIYDLNNPKNKLPKFKVEKQKIKYLKEEEKMKKPQPQIRAENLKDRIEQYLKYIKNEVIEQIQRENRDIANVVINVDHLEEYETDVGGKIDLTQEVLENPDGIRERFNEMLNEMFWQDGQKVYTHFKTQVGHYLPDKDRHAYIPRELTPQDIGKLRLIRATINTVNKPHPKTVWAAWECVCGNIEYMKTRRNKLRKPGACPNCNKTKKWGLNEAKSQTMEYQTMEIQDPLDAINTSSTQKLEARLLGRKYIVDVGREVHITGVLKQHPEYRSKENAVADYYFQVEDIEEAEDETEVTEGDEMVIQAFAKEKQPLRQLGELIAPSIHVRREIKEAIVLQMAAADNIISDTGLIRGHPHILLVGDPGTAKSRLMKFVNQTMPKSDIASGDKSSSAGINATVEQKKGGEWTLKAGKIVKCSGGILCIDELDSCAEDTQNSLKEAMEYMTVTISKAVNASLKADTRIFACANPTKGTFDRYNRISEQIGLPPALLSRFDLVFTIRDTKDPVRDKRVSEKILSVYNGDYAENDTPDFIRKYILYAHALEPELTTAAQEEIQEYYINLRKAARNANTRVIESLIRLSKASAKIRLTERAETKDVQEAIRIYNASLEHAKEDGEVDFKKIYGAQSKEEKIMREIDSTLKLNKQYEKKKIFKIFDYSESELQDALDKLIKKGNLMRPNDRTLIKIE